MTWWTWTWFETLLLFLLSANALIVGSIAASATEVSIALKYDIKRNVDSIHTCIWRLYDRSEHLVWLDKWTEEIKEVTWKNRLDTLAHPVAALDEKATAIAQSTKSIESTLRCLGGPPNPFKEIDYKITGIDETMQSIKEGIWRLVALQSANQVKDAIGWSQINPTNGPSNP
jgi:hypothetical protein